MNDKPLPIGIDDFKEMITNGYYYIDKTLFIKELLDKKGKVNLFTRPRRFGKTLNLSMLRYFFEDTRDEELNAENYSLFNGKEILNAGERYTKEMNLYPVILLSMKSAKQPTWELSYLMMRRQIAVEFERHQYILEKLGDFDKERYKKILAVSDEIGYYVDALAFLSKCLKQYYQKPVVLLIDEYDVPLENAYFQDFYPQMISFIRSLFESALKTNPCLYFAAITGCLRITKESIFTGMNNLESISILNKDYGEYFGFVQNDIVRMLDYYGISEKLDTIRQWYDGYCFGNTEVYNPWSIANYVKALMADINELPHPYWSNTSSNNIIRSLIERADLSVREEIEDLIAGGEIEKPIHEDITYEDVYDSFDNLWNFLFFTGYLKSTGQEMYNDEIYIKLSIPNKEVRQIYKTKILGWFREKIEQKDMDALYADMLNGNTEGFQKGLIQLLQDTISFYDNIEAFYHGFMLGILGRLKTYAIKSNRESGDGRFDILIRSPELLNPIIIIELKAAPNFRALEADAIDALNQIEKMGYDKEFAQEGYQKSIRYGISFYKKTCLIKKEEHSL